MIGITSPRLRARVLATTALASTALGVAVLGAAPAKAATPPPAFEIFYSPDCASGVSASRVYTGANAGEHWIKHKRQLRLAIAQAYDDFRNRFRVGAVTDDAHLDGGNLDFGNQRVGLLLQQRSRHRMHTIHAIIVLHR